MAPPPEYDKEPKAPDKSATTISSEVTPTLHTIGNDHLLGADVKPSNNATNVEVENIENLNEKDLRALLDETITYKSPKDREGKSVLFQELLKEAEKDDQACEEAARGWSGGRGGGGARAGGRGSRRRELAHSNSLQDVAALAAEALRSRRHHPPPHNHHANVSARAHHGGSLPSGVDTTFQACEEPVRMGKEYVATVQCYNPPQAERRVSASDAHCPSELKLLNGSPAVKFTTVKTVDIGSGGGCGGRAATTTTASNQVDSAISFSCITTPAVVDGCSTTSSATHAAVSIDAKPLQLQSSYCAVASVTGEAAPPRPAPPPAVRRAPPPRPRPAPAQVSVNGHRAPPTPAPPPPAPAHDEQKKSLDENGNSVQGNGSPQSGSSHNKKSRRKKSSKNETVINVNLLDNYQGNKDVDELIRFIGGDDGRGHKGGKKRSTERRKDKEKVKRASSMEELSRTKLEDLTDKPEPALRKHKKDRWTDGEAPGKAERRSWGDEARAALLYRTPEPPVASDAPPAELTDFQTVTKKRKPRRRPDEPDPPRAPRAPSPSPRAPRTSAPPSDRSNDSNDDMDSVHSLPADAPAARAPHAPPASYADIARTRHNIPDLIESCNYYAEGEAPPGSDSKAGPGAARADEPPPPPATDADHTEYPALEARAGAPTVGSGGSGGARRTRTDLKQAVTGVGRRGKERPEPGLGPECPPAPDVVADRRPPVILLDSATRARDMDGVTFGFDINEQLLGGPARRPRCDLVRDALEAGAGAGAGVCVRAGGGAGCAALRFVPPLPPRDTHHLHQIIDYVGNAWEDVVRCGGGEVRYYSE